MRLFISNGDYKDVSIEFKQFNHVIAANGGGKTRFLNALKECFEGKNNKSYTLNGNQINKEDFVVFYIGESDSIDQEKTLGTKSYLKNELKTSLIDIEKSSLISIDNEISLLKELIRNAITTKVHLGDVSIDTEYELMDLILKHSVVTIKGIEYSKKSYTEQKTAYIKMVIDKIVSLNRPSVLIVDEPFTNLSLANQNKLTKYIIDKLANTESIVIISSSSKCVEDFNPIYCLNYDLRNNILRIKDYYKFIAKRDKCTLEEAYTYTDDDELKCFKNCIDLEYQTELIFINESDNYTTFDNFLEKILDNVV